MGRHELGNKIYIELTTSDRGTLTTIKVSEREAKETEDACWCDYPKNKRQASIWAEETRAPRFFNVNFCPICGRDLEEKGT